MRSFRQFALARLAVALVAGALVAAACAPTTPTGGGTAPPQAGKPTPGGRVIVGSFADAKVLNPVLINDTASRTAGYRLYEPLVIPNAKTANIEPRLAEKFEVSADNQTITFTLRDGLKWSDGSAFTGEDFKFTAQAVMRSKATVRQNIFQDIVGAKDYKDGKAEDISGITVSGKTITVQLAKAFCPGITAIGNFYIIPKSEFGKYMDPKDASKNIDNAPENTKPVLSMGPFKFKEWIPNDHITLARNDNFFLGKPYLDEWVMKISPNSDAAVAALKTGEIDAFAIEAKDLEDVKKVDTLNFFSYLAPGYTYIGWNQLRGGKEFFQSKAVRQALAYGVDMQQVIDKIVFGEGKKMVSHTPPVSWAYDPSGLNDYKYDAAKAEQLLQQDGWTKGSDGVYQKGGQKLEFSIVTNSGNKTRETLLQVAVEQYKKIGVSATAKTESFEALVDRLTKSKDPKYGEQGGHDYDAVIIGWSLGTDPDAYSIWHSSQLKGGFDFVGYNNATVDKTLEDGRTKCSQAERKAAYKAFDKQLNEDQPYNFGFAANTLLFVNKRVQGVDPGPFGLDLSLWNADKWWVKQ